MVIFNPVQANFLFSNGATIEKIIEGKKNGDFGIMFTDGSNLESLLERWNQMAQENRVRKGLVK